MGWRGQVSVSSSVGQDLHPEMRRTDTHAGSPAVHAFTAALRRTQAGNGRRPITGTKSAIAREIALRLHPESADVSKST